MTLEDVISDVRREGEAQAADIVKNGGKECLGIVHHAEEEAKALLDREMARAEMDAEKLRETELAAAETEGSKLVMESRRKLFDAVRAGALERMTRLPKDRKERLLGSLVATALREIPSPVLRCSRAEEPAVRAVARGASVVADVECAGGIVAESADGRVRLTMTYEAILDEAWPVCLAKVARELGG